MFYEPSLWGYIGVDILVNDYVLMCIVEPVEQGTVSHVDLIMCLRVYVIMLLSELMDYAIRF